MIVRLRRTEDGGLAGQWPIAEDTKLITIGRGADSDVHIPHFSVSRHHAVICKDENTGKVWYEDLSSANGSYVQGKPVSGKVELRAGIEILLADSSKYLTLTVRDTSDYKSAQKRLYEESCLKVAKPPTDENFDPLMTTAKKKLNNHAEEKESPKTKPRGLNIEALENKFRLFERLQSQRATETKTPRADVLRTAARERSRSRER